MKSFRRMFAVAVAAAVLAVTGCAPEPVEGPQERPIPSASSAPSASSSPTPEYTKPAIEDLVLSPEGLGPLEIGQPISIAESEFEMAYFDADCSSEPDGFAPPKASKPGTWLANYPKDSRGRRPFVPVPVGDVLGVIAVFSADIRTAEGIHLGSSRSDVIAAYPNDFSSQIKNGIFSTVYVVDGKLGQLLIEVRSDVASYWGDIPTNVVNALTVIGIADEPFAISGGDSYYWGECFAP